MSDKNPGAADYEGAIDPEEIGDTVEGYLVFRGRDSQQVRLDGSALDGYAWYFEPIDYEGDVAFSKGFATRLEAQQGARHQAVSDYDQLPARRGEEA